MSGIPILFRCGTLEEWEAANPVLFPGEVGFVLSESPEEQLMKIGNGSNFWNDLPWALRGPRGFDFEYNWDGTSLGIKHSDEAEYTYVDLKGDQGIQGIQGFSIQYLWDGTSLGVKTENEAEFSYVNLKGDQGIQGPDGLPLEYHWNGTQLGVRVLGDPTYTYVDLKGEQGIQGDQGEQGLKGDTGDPGNVTSSSFDKIEQLTQSQYEGLSPPDPNTLYVIVESS